MIKSESALKFQAFEKTYLEVRAFEKRIYSDEDLVDLPFLNGKGALSREWKKRAHSLEKVKIYLKDKRGKLLEIGCGNGWLSNQMKNPP